MKFFNHAELVGYLTIKQKYTIVGKYNPLQNQGLKGVLNL
jgi:hypothetical protein